MKMNRSDKYAFSLQVRANTVTEFLSLSLHLHPKQRPKYSSLHADLNPDYFWKS